MYRALQAVRYALGRPGFFGSYRSFDEAAKRSSGYKYVAKPRAVGEDGRTAQVLSALAPLVAERKPVTVLDVGGGDGDYFYRLCSHLPISSWTVFETPDLVAAMKDSRIQFTSDEGALGSYDLVFMSGFIQYMRDPYRALMDFAKRGRYALLNRLPLTRGDHLTVQRGDGYSYPAWFLDRVRFNESVETIGTKVMEWTVPQDIQRLHGRKVMFSGMLVKIH